MPFLLDPMLYLFVRTMPCGRPQHKILLLTELDLRISLFRIFHRALHGPINPHSQIRQPGSNYIHLSRLLRLILMFLPKANMYVLSSLAQVAITQRPCILIVQLT
jgi:hypothetical protein